MADGNALQNAVSWLKGQGYLDPDITNKEIAKGMRYSEAAFSRVWQGGEPTARFIRDFWTTYLQKYNQPWENFEHGMPKNVNLSQEDLHLLAIKNEATNRALMELVKEMQDKLDRQTSLLKDILSRLPKK